MTAFWPTRLPQWVKSALERQREPTGHVRFAPKADKQADVSLSPLCARSGCKQPQQNSALFDHLVGQCQQLVGDFEAERLRGPEIDHEVKFRGLLDRHVGWPLAFENATGVDAA
jgi:hypothetical protein